MAKDGVYMTGPYWRMTEKQEEFLKYLKSAEVKKAVNTIVATEAEPYVPNDLKSGSKALAQSWEATARGIVYKKDYAHYQYEGKTYGPNFIKFTGGYNQDGQYICNKPYTRAGWASPRGKGVKYPTGRELGVPRTFRVFQTGEIIQLGYTTTGTTHHWISYLWDHRRGPVSNKITAQLRKMARSKMK